VKDTVKSIGVWVSGFRIWGLGFRGLMLRRFGVPDSGFRGWELGVDIQNFLYLKFMVISGQG